MEHLLDMGFEKAREIERETERRQVAPGLDCIDRLARDAERVAEGCLRESSAGAEAADVVFHCQASLTQFCSDVKDA